MTSNQFRDQAIALRSAVIDAMLAPTMEPILHSLREGASVDSVHAVKLLMREQATQIASEIELDTSIAEECWTLDDAGEVVRVDRATFEDAAPNRRFSWNLCLRQPSSSSLMLRAALSAMTSTAVVESFSDRYGEVLRFKSVDFASYHRGNYLRRHNDTFDGRRFAVVWFLSDGWESGNGGELIVDHEDGRAVALAPLAGHVAFMPLQPTYGHLVAANRSTHWRRTSMAMHYAAAER